MSEVKVPNFSVSDYSKFFSAGAICCTLSHGLMTPLDVVKTRVQVDDAFKGMNLIRGAKHVIAKEGSSALLTGFGPTALVSLHSVIIF